MTKLTKIYINNGRAQFDGDVNICTQYYSDQKWSKALGTGISFIIIIVNAILKTTIIKLIQWVGEDTWSEQLSSVTRGVFFAQFFNTGFLLLLVNANMTEHTSIPLSSYVKGPFYDYMPQWYVEVGYKIVQTMLINAIVPYVGIVTGLLIPKLKKAYDNKFTGDLYTTRKTGMQNYKDVQSGAEYVIHFKYSGILNIVYITMMYGVGMPILFPIAAFNFFNQWVCERLTVALLVKQPPALDAKLTNNCISMLKWSPLFLLFNGYWMLSNKQIFLNTWEFIEKSTESMRSEHFVYFSVNWAAPILLISFSAVFLISI